MASVYRFCLHINFLVLGDNPGVAKGSGEEKKKRKGEFKKN